MAWKATSKENLREHGLVINSKDADKIRQELNKVLLPSFMDDWIFKCQLLNDFSLRDALDSNTIHLYAKNSEVVKNGLMTKGTKNFCQSLAD